jgi:hypothetical protein
MVLILLLSACSGYAPTPTLSPPPTVDPTPTPEIDICQAEPTRHECHYGEPVSRNDELTAPFELTSFTFKAKDDLEDKTVWVVLPGPLFQGRSIDYQWDFSRTIIQDGANEFTPAAPNKMRVVADRILVDLEGVKGYTFLEYHALPLQGGIAYVLLWEVDTTGLIPIGGRSFEQAAVDFDTTCYLRDSSDNHILGADIFPEGQSFKPEPGTSQFLVAFRTPRDVSVIIACGWHGRHAVFQDDLRLDTFRVEPVNWDGVGDLEALSQSLTVLEIE